MLNKIKNKKGFTIIEVALVIGIAGVLFAMVFLAYPALRRNTNDNARKAAIGRALTAISQYQNNNNGRLPSLTSGTFVDQYLKVNGDTFLDPLGAMTSQSDKETYAFKSDTTTDGTGIGSSFDARTNQNTIFYAEGYTCNATAGGGEIKSGGSRNIALRVALESGGIYCQSQ